MREKGASCRGWRFAQLSVHRAKFGDLPHCGDISDAATLACRQSHRRKHLMQALYRHATGAAGIAGTLSKP
jgi:hypothetical protein